MKFSEKLRTVIIFKVTKNQGFTLFLEDTFFKNPQRVVPQAFRKNVFLVLKDVFKTNC